MAERKIKEEDLLSELKKHEAFIAKAREQLADRVPFWEKKLEDAQADVAEAKKMLAMLRGVPTGKPAVRRGKGAREEFMKYFDTIPSGTTVSLKGMAEGAGMPRGTVWGIKEALVEEGILLETGVRGQWTKA